MEYEPDWHLDDNQENEEVFNEDEYFGEGIQVESPRFDLGMILITPAAIELLEEYKKHPSEFIRRHNAGDWGDICDEDKAENELSIKEGFRIFSAYKLSETDKLWLITEANRAITTLLLPSDY